jgi:hypothetical protein
MEEIQQFFENYMITSPTTDNDILLLNELKELYELLKINKTDKTDAKCVDGNEIKNRSVTNTRNILNYLTESTMTLNQSNDPIEFLEYILNYSKNNEFSTTNNVKLFSTLIQKLFSNRSVLKKTIINNIINCSDEKVQYDPQLDIKNSIYIDNSIYTDNSESRNIIDNIFNINGIVLKNNVICDNPLLNSSGLTFLGQ